MNESQNGKMNPCWRRRHVEKIIISVFAIILWTAVDVFTPSVSNVALAFSPTSALLAAPAPVVRKSAAEVIALPLTIQYRYDTPTRRVLQLFISPVERVSFSRDDNILSTLGLVDRFDRWRFLQKLLDEDDDPNATTTVLFTVLTTFLQSQITSTDADDAESSASPVLTNEIRQTIRDVTQESNAPLIRHLLSITEDTSQPTTGNAQTDNALLLSKLGQLLPHPSDDEDAVKSLWDTVIELHGREAVKLNERQGGTVSWQTRCLIARILLHYDFLTKGL